jgi:hypothetical protein
MQHFANLCRPLTALILLAACSGGKSSTVLSGKAESLNAASAAIEADDGSGAAVDPQPADSAEPACDSAHPDAGASEPPASDGGSAPPPLGACLSCAQNTCPVQFANALGADSSEENFAVVGQLLACVIGADWQTGGPIPTDSCFFADPTQPAGSMVPCYCGNTPTQACLASGPVDSSEACGREIELASGCSPVSASCVTSSGSSPAVPLGDVLQLFNCERVACTLECGFPPPVEE